MAAPTLQNVNMVNKAAATAYAGVKALNDMAAFATAVQLSPTAGAIATADWTQASVPGPLANFNPADFANFSLALEQVVALLSQPVAGGNAVTVGQAFAALAERANQT